MATKFEVVVGSQEHEIGALYIKYRGVEVSWQPEKAVLQCEPAQVEELTAALVEFTQHESVLRMIEAEVAAAWAELEEDNPLAFEVTTKDLVRSRVVGERMMRTLQRRQRLARTEPHLYAPSQKLSPAGMKLGEELREKAELETRVDVLDGQIEVFEHVYEMASQRMGEFTAAKQGHTTELVIIWILVAEALLMLGQLLIHGKG